MKRNRITRWLPLTLALLMIGVLSGCGGGNGGESNSPSQGDAPSGSQAAAPSGSNSPSGTGSEPVTIKFLHKGPKPAGWDAVYEKYLEMTKDTLNIQLDVNWVEHADYREKLNLEITSGADWGLVFDAPWVQLRNLAPEGYYADLSSYFNNAAEYPGLAKAFTADTMEANRWFGSMCYYNGPQESDHGLKKGVSMVK